MILMYHKIYPESPTMWWVTPNEFWRQMEGLRRYQVVPLDRYDPSNPLHVSITFDGVYENVFTYAFPILKKFGYPFELFIVGDWIGKENEFDQSIEPPARFADVSQLQAMVHGGGRLQWHGRSHMDLTEVSDVELIQKELYVPEGIKKLDPKGFTWFAYPYGKQSPFLMERVKELFQGGLSCEGGCEEDRHRLKRLTVTNRTKFDQSSVSLIIANYNYGRFAAEAIESALHQTVSPMEILFMDDCSLDNSMEIAARYKDFIRIERNERNLGIIENFNKAVSLTTGDYICFLGADNRFRSDYVEKCKLALDIHPEAAIAYTNVMLFGPRAQVLAQQVGARPVPEAQDIFLWEFPEFSEETRKSLAKRNFIHGSSMYRRSAFEEVGGYRNSNGPEDHNLFLRMIERGWKAVLCPEFLLEYRQHSSDQANTHLNLGLELAYTRRLLKAQEGQIKALHNLLNPILRREKLIPEALKEVAQYARSGKMDRAVERIKEAFRNFPDLAKIHYQYGLLLKLQGNHNEAKIQMEHARLYDPYLGETRYENIPRMEQQVEPFSKTNLGSYPIIGGKCGGILEVEKKDHCEHGRRVLPIPEVCKEDSFKSPGVSRNGKLTSIILLVHDQLEYTKRCLDSIFQHTDSPFELIIVDNGSKDRTAEYLRDLIEGQMVVGGWRIRVGEDGEVLEERSKKEKKKKKKRSKTRQTACKRFKVIHNEKNLGFAAGNNQGIAEARGDYILLMNNDVVVTPGWLARMIAVAEGDSKIGIVGPMSNYVSGPQWVERVNYDTTTLVGLNSFAQSFSQKHSGQAKQFWRVVGFCMLIKKAVVEKIGGLDERYGAGNFEDDDFSLRARLAGFESWIAEDCFIHHFGSRTFQGAKMDYRESLNRNWEIFKKKWGIPAEVGYGSPFDLSEVLRQGFHPARHYCPIKPKEDSLLRGEELFHSGDVEGAKMIFNRLLQKNPEEVDLINNLGVIAYQEGEVDQAITYWNRALALNSDHLDTLLNLGHCLVMKKAYQEAIPIFEKALKLKPGDPSLLNSLGNCLIQTGDFLRAQEVYSRSYQLDREQTKVREILLGLEQVKAMGTERRVSL